MNTNQESKGSYRNRKHMMSNTKFYRSFYLMKQRCTNPKDTSYHKYGEKGIKFLWKDFEEYKRDMYEAFLKHVSEHGEKNTTIDRIDSKRNYCKENCRWATYEVQNNNRSGRRFLTVDGVTKGIRDWGKIYGISPITIGTRIDTHHWDVKRAVTTKAKVYNRTIPRKKNKLPTPTSSTIL